MATGDLAGEIRNDDGHPTAGDAVTLAMDWAIVSDRARGYPPR